MTVKQAKTMMEAAGFVCTPDDFAGDRQDGDKFYEDPFHCGDDDSRGWWMTIGGASNWRLDVRRDTLAGAVKEALRIVKAANL